MICCDLCGDEDIVWSDGPIHLCQEHYDKEMMAGHIDEYDEALPRYQEDDY